MDVISTLMIIIKLSIVLLMELFVDVNYFFEHNI